MFLSSLSNRHQTLADLQAELRDLSASLGRELLDLVNANYADFLSLGSALHGGDERIEQVRVGVLGFQRDVRGLRDRIDAQAHQMADLLEEKREMRADITVADDLLDIAESVEELEAKLLIAGCADDTDSETSGSDEDGAPLVPLRRLDARIQRLLYVRAVSSRVGKEHPFVVGLQGRLAKIRTALMLDLGAAQKQSKGDRAEKVREMSALMETAAQT